MKKLILAAALSVMSFASVAGTDPLDIVGDRCAPGDIIYYGQNLQHTKEVLICQWGTNVFYSFGKIGKQPELDIKLDISKADQVIEDDQYRSDEAVFIRNGDIVYEVGASTDLTINSTVDYVKVSRYGKGQLTEFLLDSNTVVNGIRSNFVK